MIEVEQKEVVINGNKYLLNAFQAMYGLQVLQELLKISFNTAEAPAALLRDVVCKTVTINSVAIDEKKFNQHFRKKIGELIELCNEIWKFNFDDIFSAEDKEGIDTVPNE